MRSARLGPAELIMSKVEGSTNPRAAEGVSLSWEGDYIAPMVIALMRKPAEAFVLREKSIYTSRSTSLLDPTPHPVMFVGSINNPHMTLWIG